MGVAGRRKTEWQALDEGWEHVKAEYEIDKAGGLDLILAYSYFAAKNFGANRIDPVGLNLANKHLENPISQGLFALTGPLSEVPSGEPEPEVISSKAVPSGKPEPTPDNLERLIKEKITASGDTDSEKILKDLDSLKELEKLGEIGAIVGRAVESSLAGVKETKKTSLDLLEEAIADETITPRKLIRRVLRACRRIMVLSSTDRLTDEKVKGDLIVAGAERLIDLDYKQFFESVDPISAALSVTLGEKASSEALARLARKVPLRELDETSRKKLTDVYSKGIRRSAKLQDYAGMVSYLKTKWELLGFDPDDLGFVSDEFGKLMKRGRAKFALIKLERINSYFEDGDIELKIGLTLQAFKNLTKAPVKDLKHFTAIIASALKLFEGLVSSIDAFDKDVRRELMKSQSIADLCVASVSSVSSLIDNYVKRPGKSTSSVTVYPLLHEAVKPLVSLVLRVLQQNLNEKAVKSVKTTISKFRGGSSAKDEMVIEATSYFG